MIKGLLKRVKLKGSIRKDSTDKPICAITQEYTISHRVDGYVVTVSISVDGVIIEEYVHDLSFHFRDIKSVYNLEEDMEFNLLINEGKSQHYISYDISWGLNSTEVLWVGFSVIMEFDRSCKLVDCETSSVRDANEIIEWYYHKPTDSVKELVFYGGSAY